MFVIYDTEYVLDKGLFEAPEDYRESFIAGALKNHPEIIQIAAIKVGDDLEVADKFNAYCRLKLHPGVRKYFSDLTDIADGFLAKNGTDFPSAYDDFKRFSAGLAAYSNNIKDHADPVADGNIMRATLSIHRPLPDESEPEYKNIGAWFHAEFVRRGLAPSGAMKGHIMSGELAKYFDAEEEISRLGLDLGGTHGAHNAFYDVYSILVGLRKLGFRHP